MPIDFDARAANHTVKRTSLAERVVYYFINHPIPSVVVPLALTSASIVGYYVFKYGNFSQLVEDLTRR